MRQELHSKYRPSTFDQVRGQDQVVASLRKALKKGTSRSFLFHGPSGTGKTTLARIVAKTLECPPENIIEIDAASHTGIDAMRAVKEPLAFAPIGKSKIRVMIIDEVHQLSKAAFESLLKDIEEPPAGVYWCLCTTEPQKVPATIQTRCAVYGLKSVGSETVAELLTHVVSEEGMETPEAVIDFISEQCNGSPRRALNFLAVCVGCTSRKEAASMLASASESKEAIDLCRALIKNAPWSECVRIISALDGMNGESIRYVVVGYFTKVLKDCTDPKRATGLLAILNEFAEPYPPQAGISHVLLSVGRLLLGE